MSCSANAAVSFSSTTTRALLGRTPGALSPAEGSVTGIARLDTAAELDTAAGFGFGGAAAGPVDGGLQPTVNKTIATPAARRAR